MPIVNPNTQTRVLVTGANGYIAIWIVRTLLEQGYIVRGTVRSEDKGRKLAAKFASTPYANRFEWAVVEDIAAEGAFDKAVENVDAIQHTASPVATLATDPADFIKPAVQGTVGILQSALKYGSNVKRIVVTSSLITMSKPNADLTVIRNVDEKSWANEQVDSVNRLGKDAPFIDKYGASKILAEQAAWAFYEKHKADLKWDMVVLNPALVIGRPLQDFKTLADLNASLLYWFARVFQEQPEETLKQGYGYIDVLDLAAAHVAALRREGAAGHRIIVVEGMVTWQETRNFVQSIRPNLSIPGTAPRRGAESGTKNKIPFDCELGKEILGLEYKGFAEVTQSTLAYLEEKGWIKGFENL